jgi:hypothetical protein
LHESAKDIQMRCAATRAQTTWYSQSGQFPTSLHSTPCSG